jgi:hypothetical protein
MMLGLQTTADYLVVFAIAALSGLLGGLAAELLVNREGRTRGFELPGRNERLLELGGLGTLLVGAAVGVAILLVFPPETTVITQGASGSSTTTRSYDLLRLVATSLVAGSAGGSTLTALQARLGAAVNAARVEWVRDAGEQEVARVGLGAKRQIAAMAEHVQGADGDRARVRTEFAGPEAAVATATQEIDALVEQAQAVIKAASRARGNPRET